MGFEYPFNNIIACALYRDHHMDQNIANIEAMPSKIQNLIFLPTTYLPIVSLYTNDSFPSIEQKSSVSQVHWQTELNPQLQTLFRWPQVHGFLRWKRNFFPQG